MYHGTLKLWYCPAILLNMSLHPKCSHIVSTTWICLKIFYRMQILIQICFVTGELKLDNFKGSTISLNNVCLHCYCLVYNLAILWTSYLIFKHYISLIVNALFDQNIFDTFSKYYRYIKNSIIKQKASV